MSENSNEAVSGTTLQPGEIIKPNLDRNAAINLIKDYFGLTVTKIKELNSYDDVNYYVEGIRTEGEPVQKFVFKILNSMDSKKTGHIEAENDVMLLLRSKGINCSLTEKTVQGEIFASVSLPAHREENGNTAQENVTKIHLIRLLSFVEGNLFTQARLTEKLLYEAGEYIAKVEEYLKDFKHRGLEGHDSVWFVSSAPNLKKFIHVLDDQPERKTLVLSILNAFESTVIPAYPLLPKGIVHGDFNEQNIICRPSETNSNDFYIHGLIDFGDVHEGYYVFELAITMCYMMLECVKAENKIDPFIGTGHVLAGYCKVRNVTSTELEVLRTCIASRFCQSLVMGAYSFQQDPTNTYLLTTAKTGWSALEKLWKNTSEEEIRQIWASVINEYNNTQ